jgi:hypothetical protein
MAQVLVDSPTAEPELEKVETGGQSSEKSEAKKWKLHAEDVFQNSLVPFGEHCCKRLISVRVILLILFVVQGLVSLQITSIYMQACFWSYVRIIVGKWRKCCCSNSECSTSRITNIYYK